jgi:arabinofuranan 3-O-arabinosyltransferase
MTDLASPPLRGSGPYAPEPPRGADDVYTQVMPPAERAPRSWLGAFWGLVFAAYLVPAFGRQTFDTKLGVNIDPVEFAHRLTHPWNPLEWFGGLQDQYIGYMVPMAPFYLAAHALHVPVWFAERLWLSLIAAAAFWGVVRLTEALGIGSSRARVFGAAAYALWPTYTILVGSTSAAVLPGALVPWALLPLVRGCRGGSALGAVARSGLVVVCMGGVNAVSTLAALIVPFLYLLTREPGPRRRAMVGWWLTVGCHERLAAPRFALISSGNSATSMAPPMHFTSSPRSRSARTNGVKPYESPA